jgi:hypothetical protein
LLHQRSYESIEEIKHKEKLPKRIRT